MILIQFKPSIVQYYPLYKVSISYQVSITDYSKYEKREHTRKCIVLYTSCSSGTVMK